MGCDMVVALPAATADRRTLFGFNSDRSVRAGHPLHRTLGREHATGEKLHTSTIELPQAHQTYTALGSQPMGWWGYTHGLNEHGLAIGHTALCNRLRSTRPGLTSGDLTRLVLERCRSARQAVDCLTALIERHGQCPPPTDPTSSANYDYLIADPTEAFSVETAGHYWACQEAQQVKAGSNVCLIRQDWDRISPGLADRAIREGWWAGDGSKLDFAGALAECPVGESSGLRRWGRATLLLEQQNGHVDANYLRNLLCDHYEGTHFEIDQQSPVPGPVPICQHARGATAGGTTLSLVAELAVDPPRVGMVWCAFGPPCSSVYFPFPFDADPPRPFALGDTEPDTREFWRRVDRLAKLVFEQARVRESFGRLQSRYELEAEEFALESNPTRQRSDPARMQHIAAHFVQHCLEELEGALATLESDLQLSGSSSVSAIRR